jgi:hypothetical protein
MEKDIAKFNSNLVRIKTPQGKQINDYLKIKTIGEGPYSKIKLMQNVKTKDFFAMKKYNLFVLRKKNKLIKRENGMRKYRDIQLFIPMLPRKLKMRLQYTG